MQPYKPLQHSYGLPDRVAVLSHQSKYPTACTQHLVSQHYPKRTTAQHTTTVLPQLAASQHCSLPASTVPPQNLTQHPSQGDSRSPIGLQACTHICAQADTTEIHDPKTAATAMAAQAQNPPNRKFPLFTRPCSLGKFPRHQIKDEPCTQLSQRLGG